MAELLRVGWQRTRSKSVPAVMRAPESEMASLLVSWFVREALERARRGAQERGDAVVEVGDLERIMAKMLLDFGG